MNFDKLNLDISKYSNLELKEILGLNEVFDMSEISNHIDKIQTTISDDSSMPFSTKNNIIVFLTNAKSKLHDDNSINKLDDNINLTYASNTSYLVSDTPESNPLIVNPNTLSSSKAIVNEGKGGYYPPGYINPINVKTITKTINIDSRFRDSYFNSKSSDFHIDLPDTFRKVVNLQLISYEVPLTIHSINDCNNCFSIIKSTGSGEELFSLDISNGNYFTPFSSRIFNDASANIITEINKQLDLNGLNADISYNINPITGNSMFTNGSSNNYQIYFNTDCNGNQDLETPLPFKLGWNLGFRVGSYNLAANTVVYSEGIANLNVPKYLYISINDFVNSSSNTFIATFNDSTLAKSIIGRIHYNNLIQNDGVYNNGDDDDVINANRSYYGPVDIKKLHIKVLDEYGRIVDFNNMDWSFTINLDILYD